MSEIQPHKVEGGIGSGVGGYDYGLTELAAQALSGGRTQNLSNAISTGWNNLWSSPRATNNYSGPIASYQTKSPGASNPIVTKPVAKTNSSGSSSNSGTSGSGGSWSDSENYGTWNGQVFRDANEWRKASGLSGYDNQGGGDNRNWDEIFSGSYNALNDRSKELSAYTTREMGDLNKDYENYGKQYNEENTALQKGLDEQRRQLYEGGRSAAAEALRSYNALAQQNASRYGLGTGAGSFISDLLGQEYLRSQGSQQQTEQSGMYQLETEATKVKGLLTSKMGELDKWKRETDQSINDYFKQSMQKINEDRSMLDQQKAAKKEEAVINAINYKRQADDADRTYRQGLATSGMQMLANQTGKTYTPAQIKQIINGFMNDSRTQGDTYQPGQVANIGYILDAYGRKIDPVTGQPL